MLYNKLMDRSYNHLLKRHFEENFEMIFLVGPRQVGKTTSGIQFQEKPVYLNWDNEDDRMAILSGPAHIAEKIGLLESRVVVFDEIHKYKNWKNFIKGFFDTYGREKLKIILTGSSRLDIYQRGGDSLMGRYFLHRMHPLSIVEITAPSWRENEIKSPIPVSDNDYSNLFKFGGFPQPFIKANSRFYNRWKNTRKKLLFREDIRDISRIYEIGQVEILAEFLWRQSGQIVNIAALSRKIRASQDSIRRWISTLESLYYCFLIHPYSKNLARSILKESKVYMTDWSTVSDSGARWENLVACHLLKAVDWWNDCGFGAYGLFFLRTKEQKEVDFLVTRDNHPWFMVEVKSSPQQSLNRNLEYFQDRIGAPFAFQAVMEMDFVDRSCFEVQHPVKVPGRTLLSQLE